MSKARDLGDAANIVNFLDNITSDVQAQLTALLTPAGIIQPFGGATAPTGYLACEGQEVLQSAYPALYTAIGTTWGTASNAATHFKVPDFRGAFLRGTGSHGTYNMANGSDFAGQAVGGFELDQFQGHKHLIGYANAASGGYSNAYVRANSDSGNTDSFMGNTPTTDETNGTPRVGDETRPFNASILYIIKT